MGQYALLRFFDSHQPDFILPVGPHNRRFYTVIDRMRCFRRRHTLGASPVGIVSEALPSGTPAEDLLRSVTIAQGHWQP